MKVIYNKSLLPRLAKFFWIYCFIFFLISAIGCSFLGLSKKPSKQKTTCEQNLEDMHIDRGMNCDAKIDIIGEQLEKLKEEWRRELEKEKEEQYIPPNDQKYNE